MNFVLDIVWEVVALVLMILATAFYALCWILLIVLAVMIAVLKFGLFIVQEIELGLL